MIKSDRWIAEKAIRGMIDPFVPEKVTKGVLSYGVSAYGYDLRLGYTYLVPQDTVGYFDPKQPANMIQRTVPPNGNRIEIRPRSFILGSTIEYIRVPKNVTIIPMPKSTYARCGLIANVTTFDAGWEGIVTVSLVNPLDVPLYVYAGEGIVQIHFFEGEDECLVDYEGSGGKYSRAETVKEAMIS